MIDEPLALVAVCNASHMGGGMRVAPMAKLDDGWFDIIALRKVDGTFDTTPEPDVTIDAGDVLVGVGTTDELRALEDLFALGV